MEKIKDFTLRHTEFFTIFGLCILFYFIFFHNIWTYALMDVDESRYVSMAKDMFHSKDFLTLYLNGEYFFEKPPLYFWGECLSFGLFGKITEATARFPVALYGTMGCFFMYFIGKKVISRTYGVVSSLILATSLEFLILAKFAILDILVSICVCFSIGFGLLTLFCKEEHKKYFWWLFYIFSGLAVMAKGIPGFILPFGTLFFIYIVDKKFKELFKPQYFIVGFILFFLITIPWHAIMLKLHDPLFFNEYIIKHHLERFFGEDTLGRKQPFYFYLMTILWGFFPWIISLLAVTVRKIAKKDFANELTTTRKFLLFNGIIALFILTFFSVSDTKLITYILPIYPFLAFLGGYIWTNYATRGEYSRIINKTVYAVGALFILASFIASIAQVFLPEQLYNDIKAAQPLCVIAPLIFGIASIIFAKKGKYLAVFFSYVIFIAAFSAYGTEKFFEVDYKFGQDDLLKYAQISKEQNKTLTCYGFSHKYSLIYYSDKHVEFGKDYTINELQQALDKKDNLVIIRHKNMNDEVKKLKFKVIEDGRKYTLVQGY